MIFYIFLKLMNDLKLFKISFERTTNQDWKLFTTL